MSYTLYGFALSGHSHRAELFLNLLGLEYRLVTAGAEYRQTDAYLALNPLRQIPVLVDGDLVLPDSNAILMYLARKHDPAGPWLPTDPVRAGQVQRWLSLSAGELRFGPALARLITLFHVPGDLAAAQAMASRLLTVMEQQLGETSWLVSDSVTLADIALYSYTKRAPDGGIDLTPYPQVQAWLARVESLPRFLPMPTEMPQ